MTVLADVETVALAAVGSPGPICPSAQARPPSADARIAAPITSNACDSRQSCGAKAASVPAARTDKGGLIQKTDCQPKVSVRKPPNTGPAAVVNADAAAQIATAALRSARG